MSEQVDVLDSPLAGVICEKAFFDAVFVHSPVGIVLTDSTGKFLDTNDACAHLFGYSRSELVGKSFQELTYQEDVLQDMKMFNTLLKGVTGSYEMAKRFVRKDGTLVWAKIKVNSVWIDDKMSHTVKHIMRIEPQVSPSQVVVTDLMRDPLVRRYANVLLGLLGFSTITSIISVLHLLGIVPGAGH